MAQIRIDTEYTREVGRRFTAEGDRLAEIGQELQEVIFEDVRTAIRATGDTDGCCLRS